MKKKAETSYQPLVELTKPFESESYEEYVFACWCATLMKMGYIEEAYRPDPIVLNPKVEFSYTTSGKEQSFTLVRKSAYRGDMYIKWAEKARGKLFITEQEECYKNPSPLGPWCKTNFLFYCRNGNSCIVDVKGTFSPTNQTPFSRTQQACMMQDLFVQKVIPLGNKGLFMCTFAPEEYLYTPAKKKRRSKFRCENEWEQFQKSILSND